MVYTGAIWVDKRGPYYGPWDLLWNDGAGGALDGSIDQEIEDEKTFGNMTGGVTKGDLT